MIVHFQDGTKIECTFEEFQQMVSAGYIRNSEKAIPSTDTADNRKVLSQSSLNKNIDL